MKNHWLNKRNRKSIKNERAFGVVHVTGAVDYDPLEYYPVCSGTLVGSVYNDGHLVQTFTVDANDYVELITIGTPTSYLVSADFNGFLGLFVGQFNITPYKTYIEVSYEYNIGRNE